MAEKQVDTEALRQVKETMECCICTETFNDPRMLPCIHTFCLNCIQQAGLLSGIPPGGRMSCPVCRKIFKVPLDGFSGLPKNFFVERLLAIVFTSERAKIVCGICSAEGGEACERSMASAFCVECWENFCEKCLECHQRNKLFSSHRTVTVGSESYRETVLRNEASSVIYCDIHSNERLNFFCFDCRQMSCKSCASEKHPGHECIHNVKAAAKFEKEIEDNVNELSAWTQEVIDRKRLLKQEVTAFTANVEKVVKGVQDRREELKQLIDLHAAMLLEELDSTREKKLQELEQEDKVLDGNLDAVHSFETYCNKLTFSAQEAGHILESVCFQASELKKQKDGEISVPRLSLKKFDIKVLHDAFENVIGRIEVCPIAVIGALDTVDHSLYGVTRLQNCIYALSKSSSLVLVFDAQKPFPLTRSISLVDVQEPCDMAGCHVADCLYVADSGNDSVWKVSLGGNDVMCWLAKERYVSTLSVSSNGQVVVLRKGQLSSLTIYRSDATVVQRVLLGGELSHALHAVQKSNGNFVISFGAGLQFGVCEMTLSGDVVHRLSADDESQWVKYPCHLARVSDDRILIADFYNNRVLILDSELRFSQEIISKQHNDLAFPWRLCYDESCSELLVVHGGKKVAGGRTKIAIIRIL